MLSMLIDLDADDPRPVFQQIVDEVRRAVAVGQVKPDDPLPAVRKLADELKVNANTVQHAYRTLEREGVVYVRRGTGTFVSPAARKHGKERRMRGGAPDCRTRDARRVPARPPRQ